VSAVGRTTSALLAGMLAAALIPAFWGAVPAAAAPAPAPAPASSCTSTSGVLVVVDLGNGQVLTGCAPGDPASGMDALSAAGFATVFNGSGVLCRVAGHPADCPASPPFDAYWSSWHSTPTAGGYTGWRYATVGAAQRDPGPGSVEGWRFGGGGQIPPAHPGTAPAPAPAPPPSATPPRPSTTPPRPSSAPPPATPPRTEAPRPSTGSAPSPPRPARPPAPTAVDERTVRPLTPDPKPVSTEPAGPSGIGSDTSVGQPTPPSPTTAAPAADDRAGSEATDLGAGSAPLTAGDVDSTSERASATSAAPVGQGALDPTDATSPLPTVLTVGGLALGGALLGLWGWWRRRQG